MTIYRCLEITKNFIDPPKSQLNSGGDDDDGLIEGHNGIVTTLHAILTLQISLETNIKKTCSLGAPGTPCSLCLAICGVRGAGGSIQCWQCHDFWNVQSSNPSLSLFSLVHG